MKLILIGFVVLCGQPLLAQPQSRDSFIRDYLAREESLYAKYSFNRKVVCTGTVYQLKGEATEPLHTSSGIEISSTDSNRSVGTHVSGNGATPEPSGQLNTGGAQYVLGPGKSATGFGIRSHRAVYNPNAAHPGFGSTSPAGYALGYLDATCVNTMGDVLRRQARPEDAGKIPHLESVQSTQLDGKTVLAAKFKSLLDINSTIYLDPTNDYAYLGFDSDGSYDPVTREKGAVKMMGRLTYRPSAEGFPLPVKLEIWYILPSGKQLLQSATEISLYVKYTPTADDFDLEKQFGVKPLPLPGNAAAAGRSWWWLYAVAGVLAAVTVGLVVVARRRRAARTPAT